MKISVIIPTYKPQDYFGECLDSLYSQTIQKDKFEIIVILNGCNLPYRQNIENYIESHPDICISLLQTDIPGVSNARNLGIEASNGEYITFIDDDDIVSPTYLTSLLNVSSPTCIGCANSYAFVDDISECKPNFLRKAFVKCYGQSFSLFGYRKFLSPPVVKMIHRNIIADARFPVTFRKSEDSIFCMLLTPRIKDMKLTDDSAIYYQRKRQGSVMRTRNSRIKEIWHFLKLEFEYIKLVLKHPLRYNYVFVMSRMVAAIWNLWVYIR